MLQNPAENSKATWSHEPSFIVSAQKKEDLVSSFEAIGGRKTLVPSEGRRIFPDMTLITQLERKRFDEMQYSKCPQEE